MWKWWWLQRQILLFTLKNERTTIKENCFEVERSQLPMLSLVLAPYIWRHAFNFRRVGQLDSATMTVTIFFLSKPTVLNIFLFVSLYLPPPPLLNFPLVFVVNVVALTYPWRLLLSASDASGPSFCSFYSGPWIVWLCRAVFGSSHSCWREQCQGLNLLHIHDLQKQWKLRV